MTELLSGAVEVRTDEAGSPRAVRIATGWREVCRVTNRWLVETDWWRVPAVRRHYHRCLLAGGECLEIHHDLDTGEWFLARRYD